MDGDQGTQARKTAASLMLKWALELEAANPLAFKLAQGMYEAEPVQTLRTVVAGLGLKGFEVPDSYENSGDLRSDLEREAAELADRQLGQVVAGEMIWFDPPSPEPGQPFYVCWQEQNAGEYSTGPYQALVRIGGLPDSLVECGSLDPGASADRRGWIPAVSAGSYLVYVATPWLGSDDPAQGLTSPAGRTFWITGNLAVGAEASAYQQSQAEDQRIRSALAQAQAYAATFASDSNDDLHSLIYALQSVALVTPTLDSEQDLQGVAMELLSYNPKSTDSISDDPSSLSAEAYADARSKAMNANTVLYDAMIRIGQDNPVDHELSVKAAWALLEAADTIRAEMAVIRAESAERQDTQNEYETSSDDEPGGDGEVFHAGAEEEVPEEETDEAS